MGASGGTRRGNGRGYGGPATGVESNSKAGKAGPGKPRADVLLVIKAEKAERIETMKQHLIGLALTAEREADQITATLGFLKHEDGPAQRLQISGEGGGPLMIVTGVPRPVDDISG